MIKIFLLIFFLINLTSCIPQATQNKIGLKDNNTKIFDKQQKNINESPPDDEDKNLSDTVINSKKVSKTINIILSSRDKHQYTTKSFLNVLELAVFDIKNSSITFNIETYENLNELEKFFLRKSNSGGIFIGPLTSKDTNYIKKYCNNNVLIFSFASDRSLAEDCIFLFNFFVEDELRKIFSYLKQDSKVALLYPNNEYGQYVNSLIDAFAEDSKSTLLYKLSYEEDLEDIRTRIKQLGKYDYRKNELERQKQILKTRNDETSLASLKKLEKFETIGNLDFNNLIISDGNIRILEIAPLLPFYDIDPNHVQFIGTGLWDEKSFFDEPSLQGAVFPGIDELKRKEFINKYTKLYLVPPPRISTIMYDLTSLIALLLEKYDTVDEIKNFLNGGIIFNGLDGHFSISNNIVERDLKILRILNGKAVPIN